MLALNCPGCPELKEIRPNRGGIPSQRASIDGSQDDRSSLTVFFAKADKVRTCQDCKACFVNVLKMPGFWWSQWCKRLNGYSGSEATVGQDGKVDGYNTWFRFLVKRIPETSSPGGRVKTPLPRYDTKYEWLKLNVFIRWDASTKKNIVVAFDPKPHIQNLLINHLVDAIHSEDPYSIYVPLAQLAVGLQEDAVWRIRDAVRDVEKSRTAKDNPQIYPAERRLSHVHDLARHTIHVNETLNLTAQTLHSMIEYHNRFADRPATPPAAEPAHDDGTGSRSIRTTHEQQQAHDHLRCFQEAIQALCLRSVANKDRLHNEIQYSFNLVAQNISNKSNDIHQAVQSDSSVMKTVALATAAFIPMTFVATLFGTQFFLYRVDDGSWNMSDKFWIFFATGIPFTSLVGFLSYSYHRREASGRGLLCLREGFKLWNLHNDY